MTLFLIVLPFAVFAILMHLVSIPVSLFMAATVATAVVAYDLRSGRSLKMLSAGTALLFLLVGCYAALIDGHVSATSVRIAVDAGTLAIALFSLAIRLPFTIQYARESVDAETARLPNFRRVNYILTSAWSAAFVLMLAADLLAIYAPGLPLWVGLGIAFAARNAAVYFTRWYPQHRRDRMAREATAK